MRVRHWLVLGLVAVGHAAAQVVPATPPTNPDPVVARVDGTDIRYSNVTDALQSLPEEVRNIPPNVLYPLVIDQMINQRVLAEAARKAGLQNDPAVQRQVREAEDRALQNALVLRELNAQITDAAVRARYDAEIANKPPQEEIRVRHILVATEAEARAIIEELKKGGDFAAIATSRTTDPSGRQNGGDLGFFKKDDMVPEFAEAAFALTTPGQITETPVRSPFGWHVIKLEERRTVPQPSFESVRDELRQQMFEQNVQGVIDRFRAAATVERFNLDGSPLQSDTPATAPATPAAPAARPAR